MPTDEIVMASSQSDTEHQVRHKIAARVESARDVQVITSLAGIVAVKGDARLEQTGAGAIAVEGDVDANQSIAGALVGQNVTGERVFTGAAVARDLSVRNSRIGLALAGKMQVSDDSRVLIGPVAALIFVGAILGFFGLVVLAGVFAVRSARAWRPSMPSVSWHRMGD